MQRLILAMLVLAFAGTAAESHPLPMWQLNGASNRIYLLGSVHLLREQDYPIPSTIYTAYGDADTLIMELDMDDLDPAVTQALVSERRPKKSPPKSTYRCPCLPKPSRGSRQSRLNSSCSPVSASTRISASKRT